MGISCALCILYLCLGFNLSERVITIILLPVLQNDEVYLSMGILLYWASIMLNNSQAGM